MVEVEVSNLFFTEIDSSGVTLLEKEGTRKLQIIIGDFEAQAIALALENIKPPRPITHDLLASIIDLSEMHIEKLLISHIKNNTYFAELHIIKNGILQTLDLRPSDGLALAVRLQIPIFIDEVLFSKEISKSSKSPVSSKLESLEKQLKEAVENEDYEKAASIRDQIKSQDKSN